MRVTFEGTIHEILDQIEGFCANIIKDNTPVPVTDAYPKAKKSRPKIEHTVVEKIIHAPEPEPACPTHEVAVPEAPEDLLGAVMALVNGDKEKKAKLVAILATYEVKTIGALGAGQRDMFWAEAKKALA